MAWARSEDEAGTWLRWVLCPQSGWERRVVTSTQSGRLVGGAWEEAVLGSFMSDSSPPVLCPWDSPFKNTGVGCHSSCRRSSRPRDQTHGSCIDRQILYRWASRKTPRSRQQNDSGFGQVRFRCVYGPAGAGASSARPFMVNSCILKFRPSSLLKS